MPSRLVYFFCLLLLLLSLSTALPNVIFHGMGDQCVNPGMTQFTDYIKTKTGDYTTCVIIGKNEAVTSLTDPMQDQSDEACQKILSDPNLQGDFNVMGLSQGALIARSIIEKCPTKGKVSKYLSIGGPQLGVFDLPKCSSGPWCSMINWVTRGEVYNALVQATVAPSNYFVDISELRHHEYLEFVKFLPHLNNEALSGFNQTITDRMAALDGVMLVMFENDTMVYPKESEWFQYFNENKTLLAFNQTDSYQKNLVGLKDLYAQNKISFVSLPGDHLEFTEDDINKYFIPFLTK